MNQVPKQTPEEQEALRNLEAVLAEQQECFQRMLPRQLAKAYEEIVLLQKRVTIAQRTESFMDGVQFGARLARESETPPPTALC